MAYPGPTQVALTQTPKGKKPFYISHYGRHGSRRMTKSDFFKHVLSALDAGEEKHILTPLGADVKKRVERMEFDAKERLGELTELGAQQHRDIITRMALRFPEVFMGNATVDAKSTTSIRCILSMTNALVHLKSLYPQMNMRQNASLHDLHHLFHNDQELISKAQSKENYRLYDEYCNKYPTWQRIVSQLFTDTTNITPKFDGPIFASNLFRLAAGVQDTDLRDEMTLFDLYTKEELYQNWKKENAYWYLAYGFCKTNGNVQPYGQRYLLRDVIEKADSCLLLEHPGLTLRYGHDTALLPFICLLGINGYNLSVDDLDLLEEKGWVDYHAIPMAGNVQIIFYRKNIHDKDILIKVLLNENEATLPIQTDVAPYYHWSDFRNYYLKLIDDYEQTRQAD